MNSTPAPLSTAAAARSIWSGTGGGNTSPGQAADSMPGPHKPPGNRSCAHPPPPARPPPPLSGDGSVPPHDPPVLHVHGQLRVGSRQTAQRVRHHGLRDV